MKEILRLSRAELEEAVKVYTRRQGTVTFELGQLDERDSTVDVLGARIESDTRREDDHR